MEQQLNYFIQYLEQVRKSSRNTVLSYRRDLEKFLAFLDAQEISDFTSVNETTLNAYILMMEQKQFATSTISRNIAALKASGAILPQGSKPRKSKRKPRKY